MEDKTKFMLWGIAMLIFIVVSVLLGYTVVQLNSEGGRCLKDPKAYYESKVTPGYREPNLSQSYYINVSQK
jgi:hypothetical protein